MPLTAITASMWSGVNTGSLVRSATKAAGGDLCAGAVVDWMAISGRTKRANGNRLRAGSPSSRSDVLVLPVAQRQPDTPLRISSLGGTRRVAEQQPVAPARGAEVGDLGRAPQRVGDRVDRPRRRCRTSSRYGPNASSSPPSVPSNASEAQGAGHLADQAQPGPAADAAGRVDHDVAQPARRRPPAP